MKQKTIIQLWGAQGCGKTGTIKILREEIIIKYLNSSHNYALPLPKGDISDVLSINNFKVGIESMGDYLWAYDLHKRLNDLVLTCDIIICTSRVYNDVSKHIEHLANTNGYRLIKVTNYRSIDPSLSNDELNKLSAIHLLDLVDQIITGVL
jgi:hypothetical protein